VSSELDQERTRSEERLAQILAHQARDRDEPPDTVTDAASLRRLCEREAPHLLVALDALVFDESNTAARLGGGAQGNVWRAMLHGTPCAAKVLPFSREWWHGVALVKELRAHGSLRHRRIVQLVGVAVRDDACVLLTEV
jgi:hypothetical protein